MHDMDTHKHENAKYLTTTQRNAIFDSIRRSPHLTPSGARRGLSNCSPQKHIPATMMRSIRHAVRKDRAAITDVEFADCDGPISDKHGDFTRLCQTRFLEDLMARHNDPDDDYHLDMHQAVCISYNLEGSKFMR